MKKRPELLAKSLSGLTALALVFASVPAPHIHAEDMSVVDEFSEEASADEFIPAVYHITEFVDFQKDDDGNFIDEETKKEYGKLTALPGTPLKDLGLPEDLVLNGYYEADGPDILTTLEILDVDWILKSDTDEMYSETTPEGKYSFIPDFDNYLLESDVLDEIQLVEGLKMLSIPVIIELPEVETEYVEPAPEEYVEYAPEEAYTEFTPEEEFTEFAPEEEFAEFTPEEEFAEFTPEEEFAEFTPEEEFTESTPEEEFAESTPEEDIFSGLDDSMLGAENSDTIITYDQDGNIVEVYTDPTLTDADLPVLDGTENDDMMVDPTIPPMDPSAISFSTDLLLTDVNGNPVYKYSEAELALLSLTTDINVPVPTLSINVGCDTDLSFLNAEFDLPDGKSLDYSYTDDIYNYEDFSQMNAMPRWYNVSVIHEDLDYAVTSHRLCITVTKADHVWNTSDCVGAYCANCDAVDSSAGTGHTMSAPSCTEASKCSVCGHTEGSALGHTMTAADCDSAATCSTCGFTDGTALGHDMSEADCTSPSTCLNGCGYTEGTAADHDWIEASCSDPKTCVTCGATQGEKLGHDWSAATCTEPKICDTCGITKGEKLGHAWLDATCTEPKTCDRCGATKGNALGHELYDDWQTTKNSTDTTHGEQVRYCHRDDCDYKATRALNIVGNPAYNTIANLSEGAQYNLNTKITFTAIGSAMGNTNPINGDVRYVPTSWNIQNTPGNFTNGYTGAFSITKAGSYTVSVIFQKQIYQDGWKATDVVDSKAVTFTVGNLVQGNIVQGTADGIKINPQTGDMTQIIPFVIAAVVALAAILGVLVYKRKRY